MSGFKRRASGGGGSSQGGVSSDGSSVTISDGWRDLTVPAFTVNSMAYGAASQPSVPGTSDVASDTVVEEEDAAATSNGAYDELLATLAAPHGEVPSLVKTNTWLYAVLTAFTFSAFFASQSELGRREILQKKEFAFELIIGWIVRLFNGKCWVLPIVLLSLWLFHSGASKPIWKVGGKLKLFYSKAVTERIAVDLGNRIQKALYYPSWASRKITLCVFDICLVKFNTSYEGCRDLGDGTWNYLFINWFIKPISTVDVPGDFDPAAGNHPYLDLFALVGFLVLKL